MPDGNIQVDGRGDTFTQQIDPVGHAGEGVFAKWAIIS